MTYRKVPRPTIINALITIIAFSIDVISCLTLVILKLVGAVGLEPTVAFGGGFTARWGYQFSYTPVIMFHRNVI